MDRSSVTTVHLDYSGELGERIRKDSLAPVRHFEARRIIVPPSSLAGFLLLDGCAGRVRCLPDGGRQIVELLLPGDIYESTSRAGMLRFPLVALADVRAVDICTGRGGAFSDDAKAQPATTVTARMLSEARLLRAQIGEEWLINIGRRTALERTAHLFCELFVRLDRVRRANGDSYALPLTQSALADVLALTSVHVNRTLTRLAELRLVTFRAHRVVMHDHGGLRRLAGFDPGYLSLT